MNRLGSFLLPLLLVLVAAPAVEAQGSFKYGNSLQFTSDDEQVKIKVGGRIMSHWTWWSEDEEFSTAGADPEDGVIFRRARLYMSGTIFGNIGFKGQYEFAGGDVDFTDAYLEFKDVAYVGNVRVGQQHETFGLETLTSSNYMTFIERSSGSGPIAPGRSTGIKLVDVLEQENMRLSVGAYRDSDSDGDDVADNAYSFTGRFSYLPWEDEDSGDLVHVGLGASLRNPEDDMIRYAADPSVRPSVDFLDTGMQSVDMVTLIGLEAASVHGPLSFQGEYMMAMNDGADGTDDFDVSDFYVQVSYFLTGEQRPYNYKRGSFGRIKPKANYGSEEGNGAWELALRYGMTDFDDGSINGGTMSQITGGVTWYLNPLVRVRANVVVIDVEDIAGNAGLDGNAEAFTMAFHIDF